MKPPPCVLDRWQLDSKAAIVPSLTPGQSNLVNEDEITIANSLPPLNW